MSAAYKKFLFSIYLKIFILGLLANLTFFNVLLAQNKTKEKILIPEINMGSSNSETFKVLDIGYNPINRGLNYLYASVKNETDKELNIGLDLLTSSPDLYLGNWQWQYAFRISAREDKTIEVPIVYRGLTSTPTLKITFGDPQLNKWGFIEIKESYYSKSFQLEITKNAETVLSKFRKYNIDSSCFYIYAYRGYLDEMKVNQISQKRDLGCRQLKNYLSIEEIPEVRFLFYPDHGTKKSETGHTGVGWAINKKIVEVYNDSTKFDPIHELVHIIANEIGNPPAIFNEGLAIYLSEKFGSDALEYFGNRGKEINSVVKKLSEENKLIPIDSLISYSEIGGRDFSITYPQAGSFVKFLIERFGLDKFKSLYNMLKTDSNITSVNNKTIIKGIYQVSLSELEREWLKYLSN